MTPQISARLPRARVALIAALTAALIAAPVVALSVLSARAVEADLTRRISDERAQTAEVAGRLLDTVLENAAETTTLLSKRVPLREALVRADGRELARHLADLHSVSTLYASTAAFSPRGILLAREPHSDVVGLSFATRDYFRGALTATGPFVSEAFRSAATAEPVIGISVAVRDGERVLGVLLLTMSPADVLRAVDPAARLAGRSIIIADDADRVIASTDRTHESLAPAGLADLRDRAGSASFRSAIGGSDRFVSVVSLARADWTVYVLDDPAVALAIQRDLQRNLGGGAAAMSVVAVLIGLLLASLYAMAARKRDALVVAEAGLREMNTELQAAGRHKSEFLANMSHELRTPLNAILGFSQLMREQTSLAPEKRDRYLRNISDAGSHLLALINDVLDLAKVEAGRIELRPESTTIQAVLEPVVSATRAAADERSIALDTAVESAVLEADSGRLRQIFYNLLSNAVKFTPPGGTVCLRTWADGRDLHAEISDSGIGIPLDRQSRLFDVFDRVNEDRSDAQGTGLGLALTRQLVELHSGSITFESAEGRGTTFRLSLPGVVPEPVAGDRVLVVEDDPRAADLTVAFVAAAGLRSEVATTVPAALDAARRRPPIAVLLDLQLPGARGETVLRELRACTTTRAIPIAIVSVEDDDAAARALGADEHFRKPVEQDRLSAWLRQVTVGHAPAGAPAA